MAFVRYKSVKGRKYYQYVRNYREGGRRKQEVLCHLGPHDSLEGAIDHAKQMTLHHSRRAAQWRKEADDTEGYLLEFYGKELRSGMNSEVLDLIIEYDEATLLAARDRSLADKQQAKFDKYVAIKQQHS
jgi:hypothetical protein